ncbi:hypothetical protein ACFVZ2_36685, partial [Streptomyces lasiicapitis]
MNPTSTSSRPHRTSRRRALPAASAAVAVLAGLTLTAGATAPASGAPAAASALSAPASRTAPAALVHALPGDQVFPESVAVDPATGRVYVGAVQDGTTYTRRGGAPRAQRGVS